MASINPAERRPWGNVPPEAQKYLSDYYPLNNIVDQIRVSKEGGVFRRTVRLGQEMIQQYLQSEVPKVLPIGTGISIAVEPQNGGRVFEIKIEIELPKPPELPEQSA